MRDRGILSIIIRFETLFAQATSDKAVNLFFIKRKGDVIFLFSLETTSA